MASDLLFAATIINDGLKAASLAVVPPHLAAREGCVVTGCALLEAAAVHVWWSRKISAPAENVRRPHKPECVVEAPPYRVDSRLKFWIRSKSAVASI